MRFLVIGCLLGLATSATGEVRVFQEGLSGWSGTFDRIVIGDGTAIDGASVESYFLDGDPFVTSEAEDKSLLLRFDGIFGEAAGQVPLDATILSARLILKTEENPSVGPYVIGQLDQAVSSTTTYAGLGTPGFPGARGSVLRPVTAGFIDMKEGEIVQADVSRIVRNWQGGSPNHGLAIYSSYTTDSWLVAASGNAEVGRRPKLEIEFTTDATESLVFGASRSAVLDGREGVPTFDGSLQATAVIDAGPDGDQEILLAFDDLFGEGEGQIASDQRILKADLVLTTSQQAELFDDFSDSRDFFSIHPMQTGWDLTDANMDNFPDLDFGAFGPTKAAGQIGTVESEFAGVGEDSQARADITELVKSWRAGKPNHGVNLKTNSLPGDGWRVTMPGTSGAHAPFLEITTTSVPAPVQEGTVEFRNGVDGYAGTFQMRIDLGDGRRLPEDFPNYVLEGDPPEEDASDLLRFDGVIGTDQGQLPPGARVLSAWLEYSTAGASVSSSSEGPFTVAALNSAVDGSTLYSAIDGGAGVRGISGLRVGGFSRTVTGRREVADVSAIVQAWADGGTNHGFGVFASQTSDGWEVATIGDVVARRPSLRVEFTTAPTTVLTLPAEEVAILESNDVTVDGTTVGFGKADGDPDTRVMLGFDSLIGTGDGQLDPAATVLKAWLVIDTGPQSGDSCVGPVVVEPMLVDWSVSSSFSDFGVNGPDEGESETGGIVAGFYGMGLDTECRVDVTDVVAGWQSGTANEGLMLRALTDDSWWMRMPGGGLDRAPSLVIITEEAIGSGFADYVAGLGFPGLDQSNDDDEDGLPALVEYGLGLSPGEFDRTPGLVRNGGGLRLDFIKGTEARADGGLSFEIEYSDDLENWEEPEGVVETADGIGLTIAPDGKGFYRLVVTEL
ncbi:DNRLRE domain-containing protein [Haloferula sp.]|uniref:DNRLRE domain-containing protein n=1 Tax=Haloferula sp. TaxID=2497595 RepID=UPI003C76A208